MGGRRSNRGRHRRLRDKFTAQTIGEVSRKLTTHFDNFPHSPLVLFVQRFPPARHRLGIAVRMLIVGHWTSSYPRCSDLAGHPRELLGVAAAPSLQRDGQRFESLAGADRAELRRAGDGTVRQP